MYSQLNPQGMRPRVIFVIAALFFSVLLSPAFSQEAPPRYRLGKLWKVSLLALAGATAADAVSSWNRPEANPILRNSNGQFSTQGVGIKIGLAGTVAVTQYLLARKGPKYERVATFANFAAAGVFGAAAIHNWSHHPQGAVTASQSSSVAVQ
jgi:hypothetical protein